MKHTRQQAFLFHRSCVFAVAAIALLGNAADALILSYGTEILSMDLSSGPVPLPLGPGFSLVESDVHFSESASLNSTGNVSAVYTGSPPGPGTPEEIQNGDQFFVDSFFDVFFDITIQDVDPVNDFHPGFGGSTISLPSNGTSSVHLALAPQTRPADALAPNFGLFHSANDVYQFNTLFQVPLPFSVGGDPAENDILKFDLSTLNVGSTAPTFITISNGTVVQEFVSSSVFEGSIFDASVDPFFGPFLLTGPTTATSVGPQPSGLSLAIPEPATLTFALMGTACLLIRRRRAA